MATYRVKVEFSGTCCYDISLADDVDAEKAIEDLMFEFGSLDHITSRKNDFIDENVVEFYKLEK
jgi:hypothetical protein